MCGIAGLVNIRGSLTNSQPTIALLGKALRHRGPDDYGEIVTESFAAAHCRLSVIDTSYAGHQPMVSSDSKSVLVFNGEIYNYRELSHKYLAKQKLISNSDSEVLLCLLDQMGEKVLPLLRGMFAFAFWQADNKELLLARDPFGKKPLYYTQAAGGMMFSSEVKSLLANPNVKRDLDEPAIAKYFLHEYVPAPATGYKHIQCVPMGSYLKLSSSGSVIKRWWQPTFKPKSQIPHQQALRQLDTLLAQAVSRRMIADVPVGVFLSGGLDSSTIAWYMQRESRKKVHSFSASFDNPSFNELPYATAAALHLGTTHKNIEFPLAKFLPTIQELTEQMDIPLADASLLPTYEVSKLAKKDVTVVLDGDGSDELFGGYGTFTAAQWAQRVSFIPKSVLAVADKVSRHLPVSHNYFSLDFKIKSFLRGLPYSSAIRNQVWLGSFDDEQLQLLLTPHWKQQIVHIFDDVKRMGPRLMGLDDFDFLSLLTLEHYLHNDILVKLDRATMAVALEARTPFLDIDLAEFIMKLPRQLKENKKLLKELMRGRLPDTIIDRPKQGFGIPLSAWLHGPLYKWAQAILNKDKVKQDGIFNHRYIEQLLAEHRLKKADHRKPLWTLLTFQLWYDRWIVGRT